MVSNRKFFLGRCADHRHLPGITVGSGIGSDRIRYRIVRAGPIMTTKPPSSAGGRRRKKGCGFAPPPHPSLPCRGGGVVAPCHPVFEAACPPDRPTAGRAEPGPVRRTGRHRTRRTGPCTCRRRSRTRPPGRWRTRGRRRPGCRSAGSAGGPPGRSPWRCRSRRRGNPP